MANFDLGYPPSRYRSERPGYSGTDLQTFFAAFPDDEACLEYLFKVRFDADPVCTRCGQRGRWRKHAWQKHYFHPCGGICSPMMGTIFARTRVPLQLWFYAMLCFTNSAEGMASPYLARHIGVSEPTAFHMGHRIRTQMALIDRHARIGGAGKRVLVRVSKVLRIVNRKQNSQNCAHIIVFSDDVGVVSSVLQKPRRHKVKRILDDVVIRGSAIETDCHSTHKMMSAYGAKSPLAAFNPNTSFEIPRPAEMNHGFMQYMNLSFHDQFRGVNLENSWLYVKEYQFKYNRRRRSAETFWDLISDFPAFSSRELSLLRQKNLLIN